MEMKRIYFLARIQRKEKSLCTYFARGFAQAVESMSRTEREKYPPSYDVVGSNDVLIDDI